MQSYEEYTWNHFKSVSNSKKHWSREDRKKLLEMGGEFTVDEIAEALGIPKARVLSKASRMMVNLSLGKEAKKRADQRAKLL